MSEILAVRHITSSSQMKIADQNKRTQTITRVNKSLEFTCSRAQPWEREHLIPDFRSSEKMAASQDKEELEKFLGKVDEIGKCFRVRVTVKSSSVASLSSDAHLKAIEVADFGISPCIIRKQQNIQIYSTFVFCSIYKLRSFHL